MDCGKAGEGFESCFRELDAGLCFEDIEEPINDPGFMPNFYELDKFGKFINEVF